MLPNQCQVALKEWAVTIQALSLGQQTLLVRKGGIHEESKDFRVIHPEFLLYSTFAYEQRLLSQGKGLSIANCIDNINWVTMD